MKLSHNDTILNQFINLNSKLKKTTNLSKIMNNIHNMRLLLGKMVIRLHNLHLNINNKLDDIITKKLK